MLLACSFIITPLTTYDHPHPVLDQDYSHLGPTITNLTLNKLNTTNTQDQLSTITTHEQINTTLTLDQINTLSKNLLSIMTTNKPISKETFPFKYRL
jgi:hypothetical protein